MKEMKQLSLPPTDVVRFDEGTLCSEQTTKGVKMTKISNASLKFFFGLALIAAPLVAFQLQGSDVQAQSTYFTSRGCSGCHSTPVVATCNGCHHHGNANLSATANKTSYAPGETVTVTLTGGTRTGWIGARLYNQSGVEIARPTGNQSGMGSSTTFPAVLSAPAPLTAGTYTWKMAYFGNLDGSGTGDVHGEQAVNVTITVAAAVDAVAPVVTFALPATSTSLTVPVSSLSATDNVAVTGYLVNKVATPPAASATGWTATAPTSVTAVAGSNTFYAWAKDAAGNVSAVKSATVVVSLPDTIAPVVSFALPATATSLTVPVSSFSATDNVAVTGYLITTSSTVPAASATGWSATAPTSVTAVAGSNTFYAWAKDAAGNVSAVKSATVVVSLPDTIAPVVSFTLPATATSLTVPVSSFSATDNVAVTGYLITTSSTVPAASATGWSATAPTSVTAVAGSNTFYAWAKDAAGNVSAVKSATVVVSLPDTIAPVVSFTLPATATSLSVPVSSFSATDNVAVTGYLITTSSTVPAASATGWSASAPTSVTAVAGSNTFYAWAKDAAGNVSAVKSATVVVSLPDTIAPVVNFSLPATATNLTIVVSSFTATDNVAVTGYLINKVATPPAASATGWTATAPASVTAVEGSNTYYAWAKDAAGNVSAVKSATVVVTIPPVADTTAPVVSFALPVTATSLTVPASSLIATDNVAVTGYLINKVATPPTASAAGWTASAPTSVTAVEGSNIFYAWAKDAAGNVSAAKSASVTVTIAPAADTTPPTLSLSTLANGEHTTKVTLNISGNASDASGIKSVTVNGQAVTVNADGSFSYALPLVDGVNTITTIATDNAGNQQVDTRTITFDINAPLLAVSAPADNSNTTQSFSAVTGTINETSTVSISVNGGSPQSAAISGNTYSATVNLVAGVNTIDITATDQAGNTSSAKRTVTYDNSTSTFTLAVTYPAQDITTRNSSLTLKGTVVDAASNVKVVITMDGRTYSPAVVNGEFQQRLSFNKAKLYAISVTATDDAGNSSTVNRNVIYRPSRGD